MDSRKNYPTHKRPDGERIIDDTVVTVSIPDYTVRILKEESWKNNDRNAITLFKTEALTITLIAMHRHAVMEPGNVDGTGVISVQVIQGAVQFSTSGRTDLIEKGRIVIIHEHVAFSIAAIEEETLCLLTVTPVPDR